MSLIFFTGFMCSGKTTVGKIVANSIGYAFYDLDEMISKGESKSVPEIINADGEKFFRDLESEYLKKTTGFANSVISLGGGTIVRPENLSLILEHGYLVYLETPVPTIYERLKSKTNRPLFRTENDAPLSKDEAIGKIEALLTPRLPLYSQAHFSVDTSTMGIGKTVDEIIRHLKRNLIIE